MFVNFSVLSHRHQLMQGVADFLDVGFNRFIRIQLNGFKPGRNPDRTGADGTGKQVPKIVRRVSGNQQYLSTGIGHRQGRRCRDGRLADTTLATEEQYLVRTGEI